MVKMNKQKKSDSQRGIEWTDYTWNPIGGCKHACRWTMPDGTVARCYAEAVAEGVARHAYPEGFAHHYWNPSKLDEPLKLKTPAKIFLDSMSDLMGHWVATEQIEQVLDVARQAHWHTFQLLTKNAPRLLKFKFPQNVWVGVSMPPSSMMGRAISEQQQSAYMRRAMEVLANVDASVKWVSFEPLSFDVADMVTTPLSWAIIGAASNGKATFQPNPQHVTRLLSRLDAENTAVFFKGNLKWDTWREEFPLTKPSTKGVETC